MDFYSFNLTENGVPVETQTGYFDSPMALQKWIANSMPGAVLTDYSIITGLPSPSDTLNKTTAEIQQQTAAAFANAQPVVVDPNVTHYQVFFRDVAGNPYNAALVLPAVINNANITTLQQFIDLLAKSNLLFLNTGSYTGDNSYAGPVKSWFSQTGFVNTGVPSVATSTGTVPLSTKVIYRFILKSPDLNFPGGFRFDTGANYSGCALTNTAACEPAQFGSIIDAYNYAIAHNEIPVEVSSSSEVWSIIAGTTPVPPPLDNPSGLGNIALVGIGLLVVASLFGKK